MNDTTIKSKERETLSDSNIDFLRHTVREYYTEKRYEHVLSVEAEAMKLGQTFLPDRINSLRAAALLHDITKKYNYEKQLQCCADFGIILNNPVSPEILHAVTGAAVAKRDFPAYTDIDILNSIRWHTTGRWGMTVFESIIFLADYIEPLRTYEKCVSVRNDLYAELDNAKTDVEQIEALNHAVVQSLDNTITYLIHKKTIIDVDTVSARNYYLSKKKL